MKEQRRFVGIQENGQVTLPAEVRRKHHLKKGDLVSVESTDGGIMITPQETVAARAFEAIGRALREQGVSLEELIESGRQIRGDLVREHYGLTPNTPDE